MVKAAIISIGSELLRGELTDTNSGYIAAALSGIGIEITSISAIGDDLGSLISRLTELLKDNDIVITGGGLGPTHDDITREAISSAIGEKLVLNKSLERDLRVMFKRTNREMPETNLKQAMLIPSATAIPNPHGTAPGWWVALKPKTIIALPGPPPEMRPMWQNHISPRLKLLDSQTVHTRTIKTFMIAEAKIAEKLHSVTSDPDIETGIYAKPDGIHIRLISRGKSGSIKIAKAEKEINDLFSDNIWGYDDDSLSKITANLLISNNLTLGTLEMGTLGKIGEKILCETQSKLFYKGGMTLTKDSPQFKALSIEDPVKKAVAMANYIREVMEVDIGLHISSIDLTDNGDRGIIALSNGKENNTWEQYYQPGRNDTIERAAVAGLFRLREYIAGYGK